MKILHYILGFPPYRTGGMTEFAIDLMNSQVEMGNKVIAVWPGKMSFILGNKTKVKKRKSVNGVENYEIINPLPVSIDEGIKNIEEFTKKCNIEIYYKFLEKIRPDVIHIHTLMGMHKEFIEVANQLGIKTIFTTHDYFGICPKATLYRFEEVCNDDNECKECIRCNYSALSINKIRLLQSPLYRFLKDSSIMKFFRKKHRNNFLNAKKPDFIENDDELENRKKEYQKLRKYYTDILENIDIIHFNSNLTKDIYLKYIKPKEYKIISISHKNIKDNRKNKNVESNKIRFSFLASTKPYKGFYLLKEVLDELYKNVTYEFELNVYGNVIEKSEYMNIHQNGFSQNDLPEIFANTDMLIAPSIWYETFGFTVLEALSYGVPVLISDNIGAKDIVGKAGIIVKANDKDYLREELKNLSKEKIITLKENINEMESWKSFVIKIERLYEEIKNENS